MAAGYAVSTKFVGIDRMSGTFKRIARNGTNTTSRLSRGFSKLGGAMRRLNQGAGRLLSFAGAAGGVYLLQRALRETITTGLSFEQTMVNASIRFGKSVKPGSEAFKQLEKQAKKIGITTEHTATQAAEAFRLLGGAGFTAGQAIATSTGLTDLATAAQIDLAQATDAAANSLSIFGLMTKDTAQLEKNMSNTTDIMLKAVNSAKFEVEDYLETMKFAGPIFKASGRSMQVFAAKEINVVFEPFDGVYVEMLRWVGDLDLVALIGAEHVVVGLGVDVGVDDERVEANVLHDIDLAAGRPSDVAIDAQHPDRRPHALARR